MQLDHLFTSGTFDLFYQMLSGPISTLVAVEPTPLLTEAGKQS